MNYIDLFWDASPLVQTVMLSLLLASLVSWMLIFAKKIMLTQAKYDKDKFIPIFNSGVELNDLYANLQQKQQLKNSRGTERIFREGYREYMRLASLPIDVVQTGVTRAMSVALQTEIRKLNQHLSFLATVQSISPYVGLFGTVWGIMHSFQALGTVQQATLAMVAPGISEALVATAIGLIAAIPAGIAYNRYAQQINDLTSDYQIFATEFINILYRKQAKQTYGVQ